MNDKTAIIDQRPTTNDQRPTFCTLFGCDDSHIIKDVGLIPYGMGKFGGYDSFVTTYPETEFTRLKSVPGLRVERVPKITGDWIKDTCKWLKNNAKRIDVLNLYHLAPRSFRQALTYKLHNPNGKVYLKLDGSPKPNRFKFWKNIRPYIMLKICNLISTELQENTEMLSRKWHRRIICIPNPLNPNEIHEYRPFSERSDVILFTGRVERAKGSHTLLDAFAKISSKIPDWKLKLVGTQTEKDIADDFFAKYSDMKERVIFTGQINNRDDLTEIYRDSKIFAFPSRAESFGISLTEAMMNGCFAVCSNIPSSMYLTENFRFGIGSDVDDIDSLAKNLLYACTHESEIESLAIEGREATLRRCDLKRICEVIAEGLK